VEVRPCRFEGGVRVNSAVHMCLICETPLDPDDEVIWAVRDPSDVIDGEMAAHKHPDYAHVDEEAQVMALGGWTVMGRGRLSDLTARDVQESADRL
jgi:hypothetical protein